MLRSYVLIAFRVLARRKFFTFVSLSGTGFTLAVLLVVAAFLDHIASPAAPEWNLDRTLQVSYMTMRGPDGEWRGNPGFRFLDRHVRDLPGVEETALLTGRSDAASWVDGKKVVSQLRRTDGAYFRVLEYRFLEGGPITDEDHAEARPVAVITEAARERLLGGASAVGRTLEIDGQRFRVKGVVENVSFARDLAYADVWVPITTAKGSAWREGLMGDFSALLLARRRADFDRIRTAFAERLPRVELPDPARYDRMIGTPWTRLEATVGPEFLGSTDPRPALGRFFLVLAALGLAFMALPAVNLVNVNLSRIYERASEIGVRKAFGASATDLVGQLVAENVALCLVGGAIGLAGAWAALGGINASAVLPHSDFRLNLRVFGYGLGLSVFFGVLSGLYPAWRMARLHPVEALRGGVR